MRTRLGALAAAGLVTALLAGCSGKDTGAAAAPPPALAPSTPAPPPAAAAGGACILWDYDFIEKTIGVRFDVAAADAVDETSTCVVQTDAAAWPTLALSVVESTKADGEEFLDALMPAKATKLKGLGKGGYRAVAKASGGHGPVVEIAWVSEAKQLQTLRFTFAPGATDAQVKTLGGKLFTLAKAMDTTEG